MKIRNKLTLLFTLLVATILLLFSLSIHYFYTLYRRVEFYNRLEEKAYTTVRLLKENGINAGILQTIDRNEITTLYEEEVTIYNEKNQIIYDSGNTPFPVSAGFLEQVRTGKTIKLQSGLKEVLAVRYLHAQDNLVIVISAVDKYSFDKVDILTNLLIVGGLLSVVLVSIAGWFFSGNAIKPVASIVRQVKEITASNLSARLQTDKNQDELTQLARTFNQMLARLEEAFVSQKIFVSHASHELRTPLAILTSQLEVELMQQNLPDLYRTKFESILGEVQLMNQLSNGLLALARASADIDTIPFARVRIDEILWQAQTELLKKKPDYIISIDFEEPPSEEDALIVNGNEALLRLALMNLMENGCKFSPDKQVHIWLLVQPESIVIRFVDKGAGISSEDLPHIFEPFYRSQRTRHIAGYGIGLPLTLKVIQLHKGNLQIESGEKTGTVATVILPLATA